MSVLGRINNIPVFDTAETAELWGRQYGLTGHHMHTIAGRMGYMAGENHSDTVIAVTGVTLPESLRLAFNFSLPTTPTTTYSTSSSSSSTSSSGGSSGGGGGY